MQISNLKFSKTMELRENLIIFRWTFSRNFVNFQLKTILMMLKIWKFPPTKPIASRMDQQKFKFLIYSKIFLAFSSTQIQNSINLFPSQILISLLYVQKTARALLYVTPSRNVCGSSSHLYNEFWRIFRKKSSTFIFHTRNLMLRKCWSFWYTEIQIVDSVGFSL